MTSISHYPNLPLDPTPRQRSGADRPVSTLRPFAPGDVFVGATLLNSATDRHAGLGRILQFDADLNAKGVLWVEGTTHLVYGLTFAPDGTLWAQDPWAWTTVRVDPSGSQLPNVQFGERAFSKVHFMADGTLLFTEPLVGAHQPEPFTTRHRPLPGHRAHPGDGDLWRYTPDGELVEIQEPEVHAGACGSTGVTYSVLSPDQTRLFYVSGTGPRLMQFDLVNGRQLPDVRRGTDGDRTMMHFDLSLTPDGTLLVCMGDRVDALTQDGVCLRTYRLPGFGWSSIDARCGTHAYVGNWFSGEVVKLNLKTGDVVARVVVAKKCIAGIACFVGAPSGATPTP
jgi:sugar lactone lactonase YvrE